MHSKKPLPALESERLIIRFGAIEDIPSIIAYYRDNKTHLQPFEPLKSGNFYTPEFWQERIKHNEQEFLGDRSARFFIFKKSEPQRVIGTANLTNFVRGVFHACHLGYSLAENAQGQGFMTEALRQVCDFAFGTLNLHRMMANYMPHNGRSAVLLRRLGFRVEGYAYDYLQINGRWEDHILTSLVNPNWHSGSESTQAGTSAFNLAHP